MVVYGPAEYTFTVLSEIAFKIGSVFVLFMVGVHISSWTKRSQTSQVESIVFASKSSKGLEIILFGS